MPGLILAAMLLQPVPADRWERIVDEPHAQFYIDRSTLERDGDQRTILTRTVFSQPHQGLGATIIRLRYDCARRTWHPLHIRSLRPDGTVFVERDASPAQRVPVPVPDDAGGRAMLSAICGR